MTKKRVIGLLAGVIAFSLAACGKGSSTETASSPVEKEAETSAAETAGTDAGETDSQSTAEETQELKPIRLGIPGSEGSYILMQSGNVALKEGYLQDELNKAGYALEEKYFPGAGPEINEAFAAGEVDVTIYGDLPALVAKSNGIDTTIIASVNSELQSGILVMDDTVQSPRDLEGKKVIVPNGTAIQYYWEAYVEANGIDISKVNVINAAMDSTSLLLSGEADAFVSTTNSLYILISQGMGRILENSAEIPYGASTQLVLMQTDYLKENPGAAVAINKALIRSYEAIKENPQVLYDDSGSEQFPAEVWEQVYAYDTSFDYMTPEITEEERTYLGYFTQWAADNGIIAQTIDLDNMIDTSYYEQAAAEIAE